MRAKEGFASRQFYQHTAEDSDLENRIANCLYQRNVPNSRRIRADARVGTVVVSGRLPSRHAKWLCIECCRHVAGVIKLIDHVVVKQDGRQKNVEPRALAAA